MIDPLHEDLLSRVGNPGRGFLLWIRGAVSPCGIDRILGAMIRGRRAADRIWGRSSYQSGTTIYAKLQESLVADSLTKRDVVSSRAIQDKNTPLAVISSGKHLHSDKDWEDKVGAIFRLSSVKEEKKKETGTLTDATVPNSNEISLISLQTCRAGTLLMMHPTGFGMP